MSQLNNERVIFSSEKNGYVIKLENLKKIKKGLKGCRILIKVMKNGKVLKGNIYYDWVSENMARDHFNNVCEFVRDNKNLSLNYWKSFPNHPFRFTLKHRN